MIQSRNSNKVVLLRLGSLSLVGEAGTSTVNFNNNVVSVKVKVPTGGFWSNEEGSQLSLGARGGHYA